MRACSTLAIGLIAWAVYPFPTFGGTWSPSLADVEKIAVAASAANHDTTHSCDVNKADVETAAAYPLISSGLLAAASEALMWLEVVSIPITVGSDHPVGALFRIILNW